MEKNLIIVVNVTPLHTPIELVPRGAVALRGPGVSWQHVYGGIRNNAGLIVKYQDRLISEESQIRQQVYAFHVTHRMGDKPVKELEISQVILNDLRTLAEHYKDGSTPAQAGLIITTHLDHDQLSKGAFDATTLAALTNHIVTVVEARTDSNELPKHEAFTGLTVNKVKCFICRFDRQMDVYLRNLKVDQRAVASTFRDVAWSSIGEIPGKTSVELLVPSFMHSKVYKEELTENLKRQFKVLYRQIESEHSATEWRRTDSLNYSDNRRQLPATDWEHLIDVDLMQAFHTNKRVKPRKPQQDIQNLQVMLKTFERIFVESKTRGKSSAGTEVTHEIKAEELIGQTLEDIHEGDFVDIWRVNNKTLATPHGEFTRQEIEAFIENENTAAKKLERLTTRIDSLHKRIENISTDVDEERTWCEAEQIKLARLKTEVERLLQPSTQNEEQANQAINSLQTEIDRSEKAVEQQEIALHRRLSKQLLDARAPSDKCLMALGELQGFLQIHKAESNDENDDDHLNALQHEVDKLLEKYRKGRDDINQLTVKQFLNSKDEKTIMQLSAVVKEELPMREKPSDVLAMQQKVFETITAIQSRNLLRLEQALQDGYEQVNNLQKILKHHKHYLNRDLQEWINKIAGHWRQVNSQIKEQKNADTVGQLIDWTDKSWDASANHPWVKRQMLTEDTYLEVKLVTKKLKDAVKSLIQSQETIQSEKKELNDLFVQIKEQSDTGEKFVNFANSLLQTAPVDLIPSISIKLKRISLFIANHADDKTVLDKLAEALQISGTLQKLEALDEIVISSKFKKQEYGLAEVFTIYEEEFSLQALTDLAIAMSEGGELPISMEQERLRDQLSKTAIDLKLPQYAADINVRTIMQHEVKSAQDYITCLKRGEKSAAKELLLLNIEDINSISSIPGHAPLQTLNELLISKASVLELCLTTTLEKLNKKFSQLDDMTADNSAFNQKSTQVSKQKIEADLHILNNPENNLDLQSQCELLIQLEKNLNQLENTLMLQIASTRQQSQIPTAVAAGSSSAQQRQQRTSRRSVITSSSGLRPSLATRQSPQLSQPEVMTISPTGTFSTIPQIPPSRQLNTRNLGERIIGLAKKTFSRDNDQNPPPSGAMDKGLDSSYTPININTDFSDASKKEIQALFDMAAKKQTEIGHSNYDHNVIFVMESDDTSWQVALEIASKYPHRTTLVAYNPENLQSTVIAGRKIPLTENTRVHFVGHGRANPNSKDATVLIANQSATRLVSNIDHILKEWTGIPGHISLAACDAGDIAKKVAEGLYKKSNITPSVSAITQPFRLKNGHKIAVASEESVSGAKLTYQVKNGETKMIQNLSKAYKQTAESLIENYMKASGKIEQYKLELPGGNANSREYSVVSANQNHVVLKVFGARPCFACMNRSDYEQIAGTLDNKNIDKKGILINAVRASFKDGVLQSKSAHLSAGVSSGKKL